MMVRFSCFPSPIHCQRQKKSAHMSTEAMHNTLEDCSQSQASKNSTDVSRTPPTSLGNEKYSLGNRADHVLDHSSIEQDSKSEEIDRKSYSESGHGAERRTVMKKCMSLGSGLDMKGKVSGDNESEEETDQKDSCNGSLSQCEVVQDGLKNSTIHMVPSQQSLLSNSAQGNSELVNIGSIASMADPLLSGKEVQEPSEIQLSGAGESDDHTSGTPPIIVKSRSLPNMLSSFHHSSCRLRHSRSTEDLNLLDSRRKEKSTYELVHHGGKDDRESNNGESRYEIVAEDNYDAYNYVASAKDWIMPVDEEVNRDSDSHEKTSLCRPEVAPSTDFKIKRIEEWVMDLHDCNPIEETAEPSADDNEVSKNETIFELPSEKLEIKVSPSMEAIKKYIASLSATSTAAQLVNHGLAVIPFLSAFTSLRALNLSRNLIVRITAGSLPRGLHVLNLSKNSISTVEGLRELTRLRVLDLSYNRILRIGHGLASCSSLKELYLAGNKISEVEGLHRLLKLTVLDLRFNKISTGKCLGQLAANYNSLQAISLEGNPAQKNIGDEQLKKYLHGLLPNLSYYNRQSMKVGALKDSTDRSTRIGISSHQTERSLRAELKTIRKSTLGVTSHRSSSSSIHGRKSHLAPSSRTPRSKNGRLLPTGSRVPSDRHHGLDFTSKPLDSKSQLLVRRSRSEGNLGAL